MMETKWNHKVYGNQRKSIYEFIEKSNQDKFIVIDEYRRRSVTVEHILIDQIFKDF